MIEWTTSNTTFQLTISEALFPSFHTSDLVEKSGSAAVHVPTTVAKEMGHWGWPGLSHVECVPLRKEAFGQQRRGREAEWVNSTSVPKESSIFLSFL